MQHNSAHNPTPMEYIHEITLSEGSIIDKQVKGVLYRRQYEKYLGSGALPLRTLTIDRFVSKKPDNRYEIGSVAVRIDNNHAINFEGEEIIVTESSELTMRFDGNSKLQGINWHAPVEIGSPIIPASQEEWARWNVHVRGLKNIMSGSLNLGDTALVVDTATQNLADIVKATEFANDLEKMSPLKQFGMRLLNSISPGHPDYGHKDPYLPY